MKGTDYSPEQSGRQLKYYFIIWWQKLLHGTKFSDCCSLKCNRADVPEHPKLFILLVTFMSQFLSDLLICSKHRLSIKSGFLVCLFVNQKVVIHKDFGNIIFFSNKNLVNGFPYFHSFLMSFFECNWIAYSSQCNHTVIILHSTLCLWDKTSVWISPINTYRVKYCFY